ncbi:unannotated protein [freshwater metagenome]|uniref:Unannotated protein n=1 Tax=freshwater metagenome TaxID=449393 RepID=A0A6J7GS98_9ZZZZ|nr:1,4-dihydroxy-2-naphthoate polyprenyltransferase [Actinomycetota bacterium]
MATAAEWWHGARPRTLPAAIAPVFVGTGIAIGAGAANWTRAGLALIVALLLQVGVNYANDYSDGIRGTDQERVGPIRLVGQGRATPRAVRTAALLSLASAGVIGALLIALTGEWWLFIVGAACILAAWFYTGGRRPYGYLGLGEVFVLVFFGIVPVVGTAYVQMAQMPASAWIAGVGIGLVSCAILVTNNLRDIPSDAASGKITLAVRLGDRGTRVLYVCLLSAALLAIPVLAGIGVANVGSGSGWWPLLALASFIQAIGPLGLITGGATGRDLVPALKGTGTLLLVYGALLGLGLALGGVSPSW